MSFKLVAWLSYDGGPYCGWQSQNQSQSGPLPSIQQTFENAIVSVLKHRKFRVQASGRTDAGVHALAQPVHIEFAEKPKIDTVRFRGAINAHLPPSIRIWRLHEVPAQFHATDHAIEKTYGYWILQGPATIPPIDHCVLWIPTPLNWTQMRKSSKALLGEHDFKAFEGRGGNRKTTVRRIRKVALSKKSHLTAEITLFHIQIVGSGFLKQMVRSIVGTLIGIGQGQLPSNRIRQLLITKDRTLIGKTAPAKGLWLEEVSYDRNAFL